MSCHAMIMIDNYCHISNSILHMNWTCLHHANGKCAGMEAYAGLYWTNSTFGNVHTCQQCQAICKLFCCCCSSLMPVNGVTQFNGILPFAKGRVLCRRQLCSMGRCNRECSDSLLDATTPDPHPWYHKLGWLSICCKCSQSGHSLKFLTMLIRIVK